MVKLVIENDGDSIELSLKDDVDITSVTEQGVIAIPLQVRNGKLVVDGKTNLSNLLDIKI